MSDSKESQTKVLLVVEPGDADYVREVAAKEGVTAQEVDADNFLDPATISFIIIGAVGAVGTVTYLLERRKGGHVFDMRKDAPKPEYRSKDIEYGLIKIIAADGKVTIEVKEPRGLIGQVLDAVKGIITATVEATAKAVGDAAKAALEPVAGTNATVKTETTPEAAA